jgi:hypothetical protein
MLTTAQKKPTPPPITLREACELAMRCFNERIEEALIEGRSAYEFQFLAEKLGEALRFSGDQACSICSRPHGPVCKCEWASL